LSIGVQAACMIECDARVPLMVFAKLHGIQVKDPVDLRIVRRGRLIHEAFESAATRLSAEGRITDSAAVVHELPKEITISLPKLDAEVVELHAAELTTAIAGITQTEPVETIWRH